jgi:hypothetical protein
MASNKYALCVGGLAGFGLTLYFRAVGILPPSEGVYEETWIAGVGVIVGAGIVFLYQRIVRR